MIPKSFSSADNGSEYQLRGNLATDISHHELAAPSGVRYLRKPDENEGRSHGAIGPRAFVMPLMDVDQMNLGPRFSARTHFKLPHLDSKDLMLLMLLLWWMSLVPKTHEVPGKTI